MATWQRGSLRIHFRLGDPAIVIWAWIWRFVNAAGLGDLAESDGSLDHVTKLA
ncbi:MAG: hypothetical protein LC792_11125 [Actinobacteria bacterium]|nr:hypothetical protein [Actinomycetota bacterium]